MPINTVGDLIGALQHHQNSQKIQVNHQPIQNVIAQSSTGTVVIYTMNQPNPTAAAVVGAGTSTASVAAPTRQVEED